MSNCTDCNDKILNPQIGLKAYCIDCAQENQKCGNKFPAECVYYHMDTTVPSQLTHLNIPNNTSVSTILESLDKLISSGFNVDLNATNTKSIVFTTSGASKHDIKADIVISQVLGNLIQIKDDGLFVGTTDLGKIKVNSTDTLDYLENQIVGDSDGVISISTPVENGLLKILPNISVENLITDIRTNHLDSFSQLINISNSSINNNITNISSKLAPYIAYPYHGSMVNFDATGKGLTSNGYDKVYICNGAHGTPDYRGRSPIGANIGVPGGALDSSVNPVNTWNRSITLNEKIGEYAHGLTSDENAVHSHTINDPGHAHAGANGSINDGQRFPTLGNRKHGDDSGGDQIVSDDTGNGSTFPIPENLWTSPKATGIIINNSGLGNPHNTIHPVIGTVFIMYIP